MDEPTNDLDAETLDLLEELVADYAGTLLLVSHDRAFLDNVVTSTLVFEGEGRIGEYVGGYSDAVRQRQERVQAAAPARTPPTKTARPLDAAGASKPPKLSYKDQRELDALPAVIERLEAEQAALQAAMSDPAFFQKSPDAARDTTERWRRNAGQLEAAYARWALLESGAVSAAVSPAHEVARYGSPGGIRYHQGRGLFAPQLLQFAHRLLDGQLGCIAEFRDRRAQGRPIELKADRHRPHRRHDLGLPDE